MEIRRILEKIKSRAENVNKSGGKLYFLQKSQKPFCLRYNIF